MRKEVFFEVLKNDVKKIVNSPKRVFLILSTILGISSGSKIAKGENMPIDLPQQTPIEQQNEIKAKSKAEERYNWKDEGKLYNLFNEASCLTLNVDYKKVKFLSSVIVEEKKDKKISDKYGNVIIIDENNVTITDKNGQTIIIDISSMENGAHFAMFFHYITGQYLYLVEANRTFFHYSEQYFNKGEIVEFVSGFELDGNIEHLPNYNELKAEFSEPTNLEGVVSFMEQTGFDWHTTVEKPYVPSGKIPMHRANEVVPMTKADLLLIIINGDLTVVPTQTVRDKKNKPLIIEMGTGLEIGDTKLKKVNPKFLEALGIKKPSEMKAMFAFFNGIGKSDADPRLADLTLPIRRAEVEVDGKPGYYNIGKLLEAYDQLPEDLKFDYDKLIEIMDAAQNEFPLYGRAEGWAGSYDEEYNIGESARTKSL